MEIRDESENRDVMQTRNTPSDEVPTEISDRETYLPIDLAGLAPRNKRMRGLPAGVSFATFVERKFIPEYVANKKAAGRAHFRAILKHVLPPESVDAAFAVSIPQTARTLKTVSQWPYLTSIKLSEVTVESIQHLTLTALQHGYSLQTATHIRNVVRNVYTYAIQLGYHTGANPAAGVTLPALSRKDEQLLTLMDLKQLATVMPSPGRELMLFTVLTEMSVVEICGLQWMYFNGTSAGKWADGEFIPPKTIAVRHQHYRGEFSPVTGSRRRFIRVAEGIGSLAAELKKSRRQSVNPQDFVLAARNGSPVNPENIAARHLKFIGHSLQIPWLSWGSFQRTRSALRSRFGKNWSRETEKAIFS